MYVCADIYICVCVLCRREKGVVFESTGARTFRSPFFKTLVLLCNNIHGRRILDAVYLCVFVVVVFTEGRPKRFLLPSSSSPCFVDDERWWVLITYDDGYCLHMMHAPSLLCY